MENTSVFNRFALDVAVTEARLFFLFLCHYRLDHRNEMWVRVMLCLLTRRQIAVIKPPSLPGARLPFCLAFTGASTYYSPRLRRFSEPKVRGDMEELAAVTISFYSLEIKPDRSAGAGSESVVASVSSVRKPQHWTKLWVFVVIVCQCTISPPSHPLILFTTSNHLHWCCFLHTR